MSAGTVTTDQREESNLATSPTYQQDPRSASRLFRGEAAVIAPEDGEITILNAVATEIWKLCERSPASLDEIAAALAERYDAPMETIRADVLELADDLVEIGALLRFEGEE
jgi:hypothetical protein